MLDLKSLEVSIGFGTLFISNCSIGRVLKRFRNAAKTVVQVGRNGSQTADMNQYITGAAISSLYPTPWTLLPPKAATLRQRVLLRQAQTGTLLNSFPVQCFHRKEEPRVLGSSRIGICTPCNSWVDLEHLIWDFPLYSCSRQRAVASLPPKWRPSSFQIPEHFRGAALPWSSASYGTRYSGT